jgi:hypothetical protein
MDMKHFATIAKRFALVGLAAGFVFGGVFGISAHAQLPTSDPLYAKMGSMVADDLEFYHDQTGLSVGKQSLIDAVKNNICGKVQRELIAGSLEVYPLKGYGAVEIGVHRFTHPRDPNNVGEAKFVQLWQLKDGSWKLTRVISFNHNAAPHETPASK